MELKSIPLLAGDFSMNVAIYPDFKILEGQTVRKL